MVQRDLARAIVHHKKSTLPRGIVAVCPIGLGWLQVRHQARTSQFTRGGRFMKFVKTSVAAALLVGVMALSISTSAYAQKKYTFGYDQPHSTAYGIAGDIFNAKLMELSKGTMGIDQFPGAQLGQEPVMLQKVRTGDIDFVITSTAN